MTNNKLLLDLGGTNLRIGYGDQENLSIDKITKIKISNDSEIIATIKKQLAKRPANEIIFSAAGPKSGNSILMTNRSLNLDGTELSSSLNVDSCYMLNDWESIGYCLPLLHESDLVSIKSGDRNTNQTSLAVGPGTGLGFSILRYINQVPYVFATELGNAKSFNNYLYEIFDIEEQNNFPVLESFLSGTGIAKIYQAKSGLLKTSEEIVDSYGSDDLATDMLNNFGKSMGRVLADLSLTSMATGGIYFAGSLMRALSQLDVIAALKDEYEDHASEHHQSILKNISINLITKPHTPLYGNLNYSIVRRLHE